MSHKPENFVLEPDGIARLERFGIRYPAHGMAREPDEAVAVANRIGYPVVMKVVSADVLHKSDVGGVKVGVANFEEVKVAFRQIRESVTSRIPHAVIDGILVCKQSPEGPEMIVGASADPVFGMVLMCGLGGIFAEVMKDVSFRALPLQRIDAQEMIRELKGYEILNGARGQPTCGLDKLADFLESVGQFVVDSNDLKALDLNPVRLHADGLEVLDVRIFSRSESLETRSCK
jgi:acyl-CoA synthetase (NDP forming)